MCYMMLHDIVISWGESIRLETLGINSVIIKCTWLGFNHIP
jgi:hypothetical protein